MSVLVEAAVIAGGVVGAAYVVGSVSPAVGRSIKKFFSAEEVTLKGDVKADVSKVEADAKAEVQKL